MIGICLALSAVSAEVVHVVKEPTGKAVQVAIDACAAQGGGVVCLPPGRYVSGPLWLKDRIELRLEAGATVVTGQANEKDQNIQSCSRCGVCGDPDSLIARGRYPQSQHVAGHPG